LHLLKRTLLGTGGINHVIGHPHLFLERQLPAEPRQYLFLTIRTSLQGAFHLLFRGTGDHDQLVEFPIPTSFDQNGRLHNCDAARIGLGNFGHAPFFAGDDGGMNDRVELFQTLGTVPHQGAEPLTVDLAVRFEDLATELPDDGVIGLRTRKHHFMAQLVGFDEMATELRQRMAHETFPGRQTAGQTYTQHGPTRSMG